MKLLWRLSIGIGMTTAVGVAFDAPAFAQSTDNLIVRAEVPGFCRVTGGTLDFGRYEGEDLTGSAEIAYDCDAETAIRISLDGGGNPSGDLRAMSDGGDGRLTYNLYQDENHRTIWGDGGSPEAGFAAKSVRGATKGTVPVHGKIEGGQDPTPGLYEDTVRITLTVIE